MRLTVATIVGARPQFIKAAVLHRALEKAGDTRHVIVHTGQHRDAEMSSAFFDELEIGPPAYDLGVSGGSHAVMAARMMAALDPVLLDESPDVVVVLGDTNSTLAGALVAAKQHLPLAHVEAGLRSFDRAMPEEINRVVTDHVSDLLFCPTTTSVDNLEREGIITGVHNVGDVMYDAALHATRQVPSDLAPTDAVEPGEPFVVLTLHRAENTGDHARMNALLDFVRSEAAGRAVVFPIHPRTRLAAESLGVPLSGLRICAPLGYSSMSRLVRAADTVFTDSGGLQKEAYFHRVPCVTLRENTEWTETIAAGWNRLWRDPDYTSPRRAIDEYGSGDAGERIAAMLCSSFP